MILDMPLLHFLKDNLAIETRNKKKINKKFILVIKKKQKQNQPEIDEKTYMAQLK